MLVKGSGSGILGVGIYMPGKIVGNDYWDDKEFLNLPPQKAREDCFKGITERRFFDKDTVPSDVETEAGRRALENAGVGREEIDLVLVHSMVPDEVIPGNASLVQYKLGLTNAGAWNMDTCCSSFVSMFICASNLIACGTFNKILLITSIMHSKIVDENDYLSVYVGDGASAVVMGQVPEERGYMASQISSDGYYHDAFTVRERLPFAHQYKRNCDTISAVRNLMTTNPVKVREMGRKSIDYMTPVMLKALEKAQLDKNDVDFFLSHQPSYWAHDAWRKELGLPDDKSLHTFGIYGNLASTSIPVSMFHALKGNRIKDGDVVMLASSGAGENHAAAVLRWGR